MVQPCVEPIVDGLLQSQTWEEEKYSVEFHKLFNCFKSLFSSKPDFVVKVPGRVNLIGEHIDYCRYSVCPMALEQNILLAFKCNDSGELNIYNIDGTKYIDYHSSVDTFRIEVEDGFPPQWYEYFLCGVKGIQDIRKERGDSGPMNGLSVLVSGSIPPAAGLSSSSAFVSAAVIATAVVNRIRLTRAEFANISASAERYIGTQGGGMDQAIALLATAGCAKHIEFHPLRSQDVTLPKNAVFVVAQSMVTKNKAQSSDFNTRVVECRLSAKIISKRKGFDNWKQILHLGEVQKQLGVELEQMVNLAKEILDQDIYTKQDVISVLEITEEDLTSNYLTPNTRSVTRFKLKQRALHVYEEAQRVEKFLNVCQSDFSEEEKLKQLGTLMNQSHESLKTLYECSHKALDQLVESCLNAGAYGARLTGAGWGGCVVALTDKINFEVLSNKVKATFYADKNFSKDLIFATKPQCGAMIFRCDDTGACEIVNFL